MSGQRAFVVAVALSAWAGPSAASVMYSLDHEEVVYRTDRELVVARRSDDAGRLEQLCIEDGRGSVQFSLPQLNALGRPDLTYLRVERGTLTIVIPPPGEVPVEHDALDFTVGYLVEVVQADDARKPHWVTLLVESFQRRRLPVATARTCPIEDGAVLDAGCSETQVRVDARPGGHCRVPRLRYRRTLLGRPDYVE